MSTDPTESPSTPAAGAQGAPGSLPSGPEAEAAAKAELETRYTAIVDDLSRREEELRQRESALAARELGMTPGARPSPDASIFNQPIELPSGISLPELPLMGPGFAGPAVETLARLIEGLGEPTFLSRGDNHARAFTDELLGQVRRLLGDSYRELDAVGAFAWGKLLELAYKQGVAIPPELDAAI